jgi:hypothetical protein
LPTVKPSGFLSQLNENPSYQYAGIAIVIVLIIAAYYAF